MKVALVHEFLTQRGGAERVLEALHEIFPAAPIYTLVHDSQKTEGVFESWDVRPSFLQSLPGMPKHYKWYLPLMAKAIENFDLSEHDLVISDSSAFGKGVTIKKPTIHISYIHTPTRYIWQSEDEYLKNLPNSRITKLLAKIYIDMFLKKWDHRAAQKPDYLVANSQTVKKRINQYYQRHAEVVHPPVDTQFFRPSSAKRDYFLVASRLEPYKKIDLVVETFNKLGLPLKVAGSGTEAQNLKRKAKSNIEFWGRVSDERLRELYSGARAFVFPALEDAGIMVLEALACGTPVIGLANGGTAEFIHDGKNGVLFAEQSEESLIEAIKRFEHMKFDPLQLRESALPFDKEIFKDKVTNLIHENWH